MCSTVEEKFSPPRKFLCAIITTFFSISFPSETVHSLWLISITNDLLEGKKCPLNTDASY